jgi:hypothetical protein
MAAAADALGALSIAVDHDDLLHTLRVRDQLEAKLTEAIGRFDTAELWSDVGATSMTRWLVVEARMEHGAARRLVRQASRLVAWPILAAAHASGAVSSGQVEIITARVKPRHVALFAEHEAALVPALALLDIDDTIMAITEWCARADALLDTEPPEPKRSTLHLGPVGDRHRLDGDLDRDDGAIVAEALRLARRPDDDTDGRRRTRAERDADALVDLCRRALRDHDTPTTNPGRQRPGVNVVIDAPQLAALELRQLGITDEDELDDLLDGWHTTPAVRAWYRAGLDHLGGSTPAATTLTGHDLSPALAAAFCCDSTMRRVLSTGSTVLTYGKAHATVPQAIRDATVIRDRHCRFRGCKRLVDWCEVHHITHRAHDGTDRVDNCVLLCAYHHHVLHRPGWSAHLEPDGTLVVADPHGRTWATRPPGPGNGPPTTQPLTLGA